MIEIYRVKDNEQLSLVNSICKEVFADEICMPAEAQPEKYDNCAINVLAIVNGDPAGCGRLIPMGEYSIMDNVAVLKSFRRIGIGTGICKLLIALAEESMATKISLKTQPDIAEFFVRLGFEKVGSAVLADSSADNPGKIEMTRKV